jgi:hypothetical protein
VTDQRETDPGHQWPLREVPPAQHPWPPPAPPSGPATGKRAAPWVVPAQPVPLPRTPAAPEQGLAQPSAQQPYVPQTFTPPAYGEQPYSRPPYGERPYIRPTYGEQPYGGPPAGVQFSPPPPRRPGRTTLVAVLVAVWLGAVGAGVFWFLQRDSSHPESAPAAQPATETSSPTDGGAAQDESGPNGSFGDGAEGGTVSESPAGPTDDVPALTEESALAELQGLRAASLNRLYLDGRWVAQVASKSVGITDPLQVAANGTHTFYAVDILIESMALGAAASDPSAVLVLQGTDFGRRSAAPDGQPYWVTVVDEGFSSDAEVELWCARTFSQLTPEQVANACAPRTLAPPHD